jgi:hypothetical protein
LTQGVGIGRGGAVIVRACRPAAVRATPSAT